MSVLNVRRLAWRSIRAHPSRLVATVLAVLVGTAFLAGALVLRDSLGAALEATTDRQLAGVDAAVEGVDDRRVDVAVLDEVEAVPEVAAAAGVLTAPLNIVDDDGEVLAEGVSGSSWIPVPDLQPFTVVAGEPPEQAGEIAVDRRTASDLDLEVGAEVDLATSSGPASATVVGVVAYGDRDRASASGDVLVATGDAVAWLGGGEEAYDAVYATSDGASQQEVVDAIRAAVPADIEVSTGDEVRDEASGGAAGIANAIGTALQGFAYLALFVSLFIIYNTFSIIVAQRTRELALLRALGATGKQVRRSVWVEALIVGFGSSVLGVVLGVLGFLALTALVPQFEDIAGEVPLRVGPWAVVQVLVAGVVVTLLSAVVPAFRAARTRPVEALRSADRDPSGTSVVRAVLGLGLVGLGVAALLLGTAITNLVVIVLALPFLFLGVLVGGPVVAAGFGALAERVASVGPVAWRLGAQSVRRNPRRAATTANALVIGVFLVVVVTAGGGAVRDYASDELARLGGPDVTALATGSALPSGYREAVEATPGVEDVAELYVEAATTVGGTVVSAVDLAEVDALGLTFEDGSAAALGPGDVTLPGLVAQGEGLVVGDPVVVTFGDGTERELRLGATTQFSASIVQSIVAVETALGADPSLRPQQLSITTEPGAATDVEERLEALGSDYGGVVILPGNFLGQLVRQVFDFLISSVNALLSVAVLIALFGIVNTLVLSITERTHEIGLLRAVGMTRRQLRSSVRMEAVAVSLLGSLVGIAWGVFVAWCLTRTIGFTWPLRELGAILAIGVVLGVLASVVPAYRASRLDVLDAIRQE